MFHRAAGWLFVVDTVGVRGGVFGLLPLLLSLVFFFFFVLSIFFFLLPVLPYILLLISAYLCLYLIF